MDESDAAEMLSMSASHSGPTPSPEKRREKDGLATCGSGEGEKGLATLPRDGLGGVEVEAERAFRGCSRRFSRRMRR